MTEPLDIAAMTETLSIGDVQEMCRESGKSMQSLFDFGDDLDADDLEVICRIIWACGRKGDPGFTMEDARATPIAALTATAEAAKQVTVGGDTDSGGEAAAGPLPETPESNETPD